MTSTAVSWVLTLGLVGVGVYYYRPDLVKGVSGQAAQTTSAVESSIKPVVKKAKAKKPQITKAIDEVVESATSIVNESQPGKKRKIASGASNTSASRDAKPAEDEEDISSGDKEFARQLAKTQTGTNLQKSDGQNSKKKNKAPKQPQQTATKVSDFTNETSSSAGRDADDDLTPWESPVAKPTGGVSHAGDISDMLEAPAAKPTTLRVTNVPDESKAKKKPAAQPFEQVLTKKQRQSQARKEEYKQMREESDRIHEAKKQEQLRRARMAAGTSNQTKANNFTSTSNAWQSGQGNAAVKAAPDTAQAPLLDTFEPAANNVSQPHGAVHTASLNNVSASDAATLKQQVGDSKASAFGASGREALPKPATAWSGNISEEDQMKLLVEQQAEDAWESVTSKKSKKKTKQDVDSAHDASADLPRPVAPSRPSTNGLKTTTGPRTVPEPAVNNRFGTFQAPVSEGLVDAEWEA